MKQLQYFFLAITFFLLTSCGDNIADSFKLDGEWQLESILVDKQGIKTEGIPDIMYTIGGNDLKLFRDDVLNMEADICYEQSDSGQMSFTLDLKYDNGETVLVLVSEEKLFFNKEDDDIRFTLYFGCSHCDIYNFVRI